MVKTSDKKRNNKTEPERTNMKNVACHRKIK